ncbi:hypothetical protein BG003_009722, partial [Podila horticola]
MTVLNAPANTVVPTEKINETFKQYIGKTILLSYYSIVQVQQPLSTIVSNTFTSNTHIQLEIDLAVATRGGKVLTLSDEWFAEAKNLLTPTAPISAPGRFVPTGAWYDGWETRRHNPTYDWCVIQLGYAGTIAGFEIDTSYFTGNHSPFVSIEGYKETSANAAAARTHDEWTAVEWVPVLSKVALNPHSRHGFQLEAPTADFYTHIRFRMYPDGGVARLRVYGNVHQVVPKNKHEIYDLAAAVAGSV